MSRCAFYLLQMGLSSALLLRAVCHVVWITLRGVCDLLFPSFTARNGVYGIRRASVTLPCKSAIRDLDGLQTYARGQGTYAIQRRDATSEFSSGVGLPTTC